MEIRFSEHAEFSPLDVLVLNSRSQSLELSTTGCQGHRAVRSCNL